jgi:hypothetical protein
MTGQGSRRLIAQTKHLEELVPSVVAVAKRSPGITGRKLAEELHQEGRAFQRGDEIKAARLAVERGLLVIEPGPRNAKCYFVPTYPDLPRPTPTGEVLTYPDVPLVERGTSAEDVEPSHTPTSEQTCRDCGVQTIGVCCPGCAVRLRDEAKAALDAETA